MTEKTSLKTVLTGVRATGTPHIGNYIGAIKPALELAKNTRQSFLFIADYNALNSVQEINNLKQDTNAVAATWIVLGLDPAKTIFYRQSDIPEIFEIETILNAVTPKGLIDRAHSYKARVDKNLAEGHDADLNINMGIYTYPILMASDILTMQADLIPVGKDQIQHVEFARDIAGYFNKAFKNILKLPEHSVEKSDGATLTGLDGRKMSKSYNNHIPVFMESTARRKLVMKIISDSKLPEEPKNPDESVIFQLYSHFAAPDEILEMRNAFTNGGMGYGAAKQLLFEVLERNFAEKTLEYNDLLAHPEKIRAFLKQGAEQARIVSRQTLKTIREAVGVE